MEKTFQTGTIGATLGQLAPMLGGELLGPPEFMVARLTSADSGDPAALAFAESAKYVGIAKHAGVGSLLIGPDMDAEGLPAIRVSNPRLAFFMLLTKADRPYPISGGVHPTAIIDPGAQVAHDVEIGAYAVVENEAVIESGARIYPHAYIGEFCRVGPGARVMPHAVLLRNVDLGARSVILPGAVIGSDGFGFVWDGKRRVKVPQVGRVVIGEDCEVGALSAIDRATAGKTSLGDGTKIDNLVQIAHNCSIGRHVVIAALSGIAGSVTIGDRSTLGGLSGAGDHVVIGADVTLGGRAGVTSDLKEPGVYLDFPAHPAGQAQRNMVHKTRLHELVERVRKLEAEVERLRTGKA